MAWAETASTNAEEQEEEACDGYDSAGSEGWQEWPLDWRSSYSNSHDSDAEDGQPSTLENACVAGGRIPQESDFNHCPHPQSYVRCCQHHRALLNDVIEKTDADRLDRIWRSYRDDLTWPWYESKPHMSNKDFNDMLAIAQKVVDAMILEYRQPMVLDQATLSNTNHIGHPPHADNVQFDSVWWKGKRIRQHDELTAAREGAYVLWRPEKTSYRCHSCTVSLTKPYDYEGGEVQFFDRWGDKDPVASYKADFCSGVAFCGCQRNIHAVTGVTNGFRLQLLVWTRPPHVRVPENQKHICYFRPGTGRGVWLTTADIEARVPEGELWLPVEDDSGCMCKECVSERQKTSWRDALRLPTHGQCAGEDGITGLVPLSTPESQVDCPLTPARALCKDHERKLLRGVVSKLDRDCLQSIWQNHQDDLSHPWYERKPTFSDEEYRDFYRIAQNVVDAMSAAYKEPLVLDQAAVSRTNNNGHPPHADNVQFESVWWRGKQIKQSDELLAVREGAVVHWVETKHSFRNYSASVALSSPSEYYGGSLEFFKQWGDRDPLVSYNFNPGDGVAYCGCEKNIHAVTSVKWGFRLVLLLWTRPPDVSVPEEQKKDCYFRPGTGSSIWLTAADMEWYPSRMAPPHRCPNNPKTSKARRCRNAVFFIARRSKRRLSAWDSTEAEDEDETWDGDSQHRSSGASSVREAQ